MSLFTKPAVDVYSPVDAGGNVRSVENADAQRYHTEIERLLMAVIAETGNLTLPNLLIRFAVTGGTTNAIVATPNLPLPHAPALALYAIQILHENTGPVTLNGKPWRTNVGNEFVAGGIKAGGIYLFLDNGDHYRAVTDQDVSALVAAAEEAAHAAQLIADGLTAEMSPGIALLDAIPFMHIPGIIQQFRVAGKSQVGDGGPDIVIDDADGIIIDAGGRRFSAVPKRQPKNHLPAGYFAISQEGGSFATTGIRRRMLDGMSGARVGFGGGCVVYADTGKNHAHAAAISRSPGNASTSSFVGVWNMSTPETLPLRGTRATVSLSARRGADFSAPGQSANITIICSRTSQQPIVRDDGMYDGNYEVLASLDFVPGVEINHRLNPFWTSFHIPVNATQLAVILTVPWSGIAGAEDAIHLEGLHIDVGAYPTEMPPMSAEELLSWAKSRVWRSYPYGVFNNTPTLQGALHSVATSTATPFGVQFPVRFDVDMVYPPTVYCYASQLSSGGQGGVNRISNLTAQERVFGWANNISTSGCLITNSGAPGSAGDRYSCHVVADASL